MKYINHILIHMLSNQSKEVQKNDQSQSKKEWKLISSDKIVDNILKSTYYILLMFQCILLHLFPEICFFCTDTCIYDPYDAAIRRNPIPSIGNIHKQLKNSLENVDIACGVLLFEWAKVMLLCKSLKFTLSFFIYRGDSIFWPDINNQIPDIVCALVKKSLG